MFRPFEDPDKKIEKNEEIKESEDSLALTPEQLDEVIRRLEPNPRAIKLLYLVATDRLPTDGELASPRFKFEMMAQARRALEGLLSGCSTLEELRAKLEEFVRKTIGVSVPPGTPEEQKQELIRGKQRQYLVEAVGSIVSAIQEARGEGLGNKEKKEGERPPQENIFKLSGGQGVMLTFQPGMRITIGVGGQVLQVVSNPNPRLFEADLLVVDPTRFDQNDPQKGGFKGIRVGDPPITVGRGHPDSQRFELGPTVSRQHARIGVYHDGDKLVVTVVDLGSTNGTVVRV